MRPRPHTRVLSLTVVSAAGVHTPISSLHSAFLRSVPALILPAVRACVHFHRVSCHTHCLDMRRARDRPLPDDGLASSIVYSWAPPVRRSASANHHPISSFAHLPIPVPLLPHPHPHPPLPDIVNEAPRQSLFHRPSRPSLVRDPDPLAAPTLTSPHVT